MLEIFQILKHIDYEPFILSLKLASTTTIILFILALPLAWYLSNTKSKCKPIIETFTALPLVLPPSVLGFYILYALSYNSFFGRFLEHSLGIKLVFTFSGLVFASCIYSLPFMVQPLQAGLEGINKAMLEASYISGKSKFVTLFKVALPNMKPAVLIALIVTFAHTIGEFGVVLMVGGNIPSQTKVASVAIYEFVEVMDYKSAHVYSALMLIISFVILLSVYIFNHKQNIKISSFPK